MESEQHLELKRCAQAWLVSADAASTAREVRTAIPFWRADVAAWLEGDCARLDAAQVLSRNAIESTPSPTSPGSRAGSLFGVSDPLHDLLRRAGAVDLFGQPDRDPGPASVRRLMLGVRTVLVECKVSRADFRSDRADLQAAGERHERLLRRRDRIREQLLPRWEPHLRRDGETLFEQTDGWDAARSKLASVRQADRDERVAREALESQVKFDKLAHWRLADRLYLCTPGGLLKEHEVPARWGWLEVTRGALRLRRPAAPLRSPEPRRWRTVRNIERASGRP